MMIYPELAQLDSTPDQDLALTIAYKHYVAALTLDQQKTALATPGAFLALRVGDMLDDFVVEHIRKVKIDRILEAATAAVTTTDAKALTDVAAALKIDLTIDPNAVAVAADILTL